MRQGGHHVGHWPTFLVLYWSVGRLVGLGPKFLVNGYQPSLNGSPRNLHTSLVWVKSENLLAISLPHPKTFAGENLKFRQTPADPRQSEARNFETAQHIDKQQEGQHPLTGQRAANFRLLANQ